MGLNVKSIQRQIQPLNYQIGFIVNSIQRQIQPLNHQIRFNVKAIKTDSTIKPSNMFQFQIR